MNTTPIKIRNWAVAISPNANPYQPPETQTCLAGDVDDHPRLGNANGVITSAIVKAEGRTITTASGSVYVLDGPPSVKYRQFLIDKNIPYDVQNPIKVRQVATVSGGDDWETPPRAV